MKMVFYAPKGHDCAERLRQLVEQLIPADNIMIFDTIVALEKGLRKPPSRPALAVFMAPTFEDLMELVDVGWMLEDFRTIVILPDRDNSTITMGHLLRPSFLTFCDSDFEEVGAVLSNILNTQTPLRPAWLYSKDL
jgi:hypothetical protein